MDDNKFVKANAFLCAHGNFFLPHRQIDHMETHKYKSMKVRPGASFSVSNNQRGRSGPKTCDNKKSSITGGL